MPAGRGRARRLGPAPLAWHLAAARRAWLLPDGARPELQEFLRGLQAYWHHPYRRRAPALPVLWACGATRLLDCGPAGAPPVLAVPSLINRAYILDLMPECSLLGFLRARGFRPLLLDWGEPGAAERRMSFDDHVLARLGGALAWWIRAHGTPPVLVGYCMGGLLALAQALARPHTAAGLALLATPWDFHAGAEGPHDARAGELAAALAGALGGLPVAAIQALFASLQPLEVPRKFARFARLDPASLEARRFVAVEDWLNDGVPLGAEVARTCFVDWYGANRTEWGAWRVGGHPVRPGALRVPAFVALPERDRIVPQASAEALARALPGPVVVRPAAGHVGMVVGAGAQRGLWEPLAGWLRRIAAMQD